jgi:cyclase
MLAKRIIPVLMVRGHQLVKGQAFKSWRSVGVAEQAARIYARRGVDELCLLDIAATPNGTGPDFAMVERMTSGNFCPVSVGGGVRHMNDVRSLLNAGADKVVLGTQAFLDHRLVRDIARRFGSQALCVSIDYTVSGVVTHCGTKSFATEASVVQFAEQMQSCGAGEILLTSVERDGMMGGYDLDMVRSVTAAVDIPVIAAGGAGMYEHMHEAILAGADAVAAGALFLFTDATPAGAADYLTSKGVTCRT